MSFYRLARKEEKKKKLQELGDKVIQRDDTWLKDSKQAGKTIPQWSTNNKYVEPIKSDIYENSDNKGGEEEVMGDFNYFLLNELEQEVPEGKFRFREKY